MIGETAADCGEVASHYRKDSVKLIVDHCVEEIEDPAAWSLNLAFKCQLLRQLAHTTAGQAAFVPFKVTGLASPGMLEELSAKMASTDTITEALRILSPRSTRALHKAIEAMHELCSAGMCSVCGGAGE